jgi:hypothetical protein
VLAPPNEQVVAALHRLHSDGDFDMVRAWLRGELFGISERLVTEQSEPIFRRLQGCAIVLRDLLSAAEQ